jgi:hypothetical protein
LIALLALRHKATAARATSIQIRLDVLLT